ncbi:MAG: 4Fe-4S dicluster domain-containing protein [Pseudomonadota bacterium]
MMSAGRADHGFPDEIQEASGVNFNTCLQCRSCANGCPFLEAMDFHPNQVIRLVQLGMEKEALESSTIWVCVGCNTCCTNCPMAIDIPAVMDSLRYRAIVRGATIAEPDILGFHQEVLGTVARYGRTHKLEIMMRYKFRTLELFTDFKVGLRMLKKRKLDLTPSRIRDAAGSMGKVFHGSSEKT